MCRHLAYWGPSVPIATLALDAPRALVRQCTEAREMAWGTENLDGWGCAWQSPPGGVQRRRSARPLDKDGTGQRLLRDTSAERFIVSVRQKTPGSATGAMNSAPFSDAFATCFSHNGYITDFRNGVREELLAKVSPRRADAIQGDTDSEVLFALVGGRLDDGASPAEAVRAVADVGELYGGRYNVLLWANDTIIATRWENSLYVRDADAAVVTSEPLDDGLWREVPERTMVIVTDAGVRQEDL
jgi:glutamine amidotransferase